MLSIIGFILIIILTYRTYQEAKVYGRTLAWAFVTAGIGLGFQFVLPLLIGLVIGVFYLAQGRSAETLQQDIMGPAIIVGIVFLVLSIVGMVLVLRHVGKPLPDGERVLPPPPPPTFGENDQS